MTTFLDLVNGVVEETRVTLDPLTSSTFANPGLTVMYNKFKRWVNMAYKELLIDRPEWYFRQERAVVSIWPRVHLAGLSFTPVVGDHIKGESSATELLIKEVFTFEDVEGDATPERTFSVEVVTGDLRSLIGREHFDIISGPSGTHTDIGYFKGIGTYDFRSLVPNLQSVDANNMIVTEAVAEEMAYVTGKSELINLPWTEWTDLDRPSPWDGTMPQYITEMTNGTYQMYPQPTREMYLYFEYSRSIPVLTNYNDVPEGIPDEYVDYLMWRAVQEYADWESNQKIYLRASKHVEKYLYWLHRDQLPELKIPTGEI